MGRHKSEKVGKKAKKPPLQTKQILDKTVEDLLHKCTNFSDAKNWKDFTEIYDLTQAIRAIEQEYVSPVIANKRDDNMENFLLWCCNNATQLNSVGVEKLGENNYGVVAKENIQDGDLLFIIPHKLMISTATAKETKLGLLIEKDVILRNMPNVVLAFHLMMEACNPSSFWAPYIHILPYTYSTPLYFSLPELQELRGSHSLDDCINLYRSVSRQYAYFYKLFQVNPEFKKLSLKQYFSFDYYRWAVSTVMTRQNSLPSRDGESALVPLWDMCNHSNGQYSTDFDIETDEVQCFAMQEFKKGEEVRIFYGPRTNTQFFLHSGFVLLGNKHDNIILRLGLSKSDPLYSLKSQLCSQFGLPSANSKYVLHNGPIPVGDDLLKFAEIFSLTKDVIPESCTTDEMLLDWLKESSEIKTKALHFLRTRISLILKSYSSTLEEDEALLKTNLSTHLTLVLQLRTAEKTLYNGAINYIDSLLA